MFSILVVEDDAALSKMMTARLSNQEIVVHNEEVRVDEQLRKVAITLLEKWQDRDVEFDLDLPEFSVVTDPGLLEQVWTNLLDNAVKYTPDGRAIHLTDF